MKGIWYPLLLCILLFSNCDSGSEDPVDDNPAQTTDDLPPVITLSGLPDVLEVVTELTIEVSDQSDEVTTTVNLDGIEIVQSNQKTFVFDLNPFDYNLGDKTLEIKATDGSGNESSISERFELKKLLFRYPSTQWNHSIELFDNYIAVNTMNGQLVDFIKIENPNETVEFYVDDEFDQDVFCLTQFLISNESYSLNINPIFSYSGIRPGTIFPSDEEREELFKNQYIPPPRNLMKTITLNGSSDARMDGYSGYIFKTQRYLPDNYDYSFWYSGETGTEHFIYNFPESGNELEDYSYLLLNDDVTKDVFESTDFFKPGDFYTLQLPSGISYDVTVNGYESEEAYDQYRYHEIFKKVKGQTNSTASEESLSFPIIDAYSFYQKKLTIQTDNKTMLTLDQKGLDQFQFGGLTATYGNGVISANGEYDTYQFVIDNIESWEEDTANLGLIVWHYYGRMETGIEVPFDTFEIPEEIQGKLIQKGVSIDPQSAAIDNFFVELRNYEKETFLYEATLFNYGAARNQFGDSYSYRINLKD